MSYSSGVNSEFAAEKFYGIKAKPAKDQGAEKQQAKQEPSLSTGIQWAQALAPQQAQAAQTATVGKQAPGKAVEAAKDFEIAKPSLEDVAMITTSVPMNEEAVEAAPQNIMTRFLSKSVNMAALEESYKEYFKKSKSHNLLLERFMANVKFSSIKTLLSLMGVSADEQARMQSEVKEQALAEIDSKIRNDWAYTKAMLEITGG